MELCRKPLVLLVLLAASDLLGQPFPDRLITKNFDVPETLNFRGEFLEGHTGARVDLNGDFDGDGIDDLLVFTAYENRGHLIYGSRELNSSPFKLKRLDSNPYGTTGFDLVAPEKYVANELAFVGDVNHDGFDDIGWSSTYSEHKDGGVWVIFGQSERRTGEFFVETMTREEGFIVLGERGSRSDLGVSFARLGDVNGDEVDDFVVGADGFGSEGRAYVLYGDPQGFPLKKRVEREMAPEVGFSIEGEKVGRELAAAGDFNGDGLMDVYVEGTEGEGEAAYVVFGAGSRAAPVLRLDEAGSEDVMAIVESRRCESLVGIGSRGRGDFNGDGFDDVLILGGRCSALVFGSAEPRPKVRMDQLEGSNGFVFDAENYVVEGALVEDLNGDGFDELSVGGYRDPDTGNGMAVVLFGRSEAPSKSDIEILVADNGIEVVGGEGHQGDGLGSSISGHGDFNGDGLVDLVLGAPRSVFDTRAQTLDGGEGHVIFGRRRVVHEDDFESLDFGRWSESHGPVDLVSPGSRGTAQRMEITALGDEEATEVVQRFGESLPSFSIRWLLDPNAMDLAAAAPEILRVPGPLLQVKLKRLNDEWNQVRLFVFDHGGTKHLVGSAKVGPDSVSEIEVSWAASTGDLSTDGFATLKRNGNVIAEFAELRTGSLLARSVRLGLPRGSTGMEPEERFFIDEFYVTP